MSASPNQDIKNNIIAYFARAFIENIEAVTKSKEVSKELYLIPIEIQQETEEIQKKIAWTAAALVAEYMVKQNNVNIDDDTAKKIYKTCLNKAYQRVKAIKNE